MEANLSQGELARRAGLGVRTIVATELGYTMPMPMTVLHIARAMDLDPRLLTPSRSGLAKMVQELMDIGGSGD
jgi:transcriptional regulator with XRE-family HTH domain